MAPPPSPTDPNAQNNPAPKLIIDSDWKSQAQAEKEKLAAKEAEKAKAAPAGGGPAAMGGAAAQPPARRVPRRQAGIRSSCRRPTGKRCLERW
ncbi:MAG: hypothetical protein QM783_06530 [Phycisphaerales bacterium]